jgi:CDGSH-type Zn-finger protein
MVSKRSAPRIVVTENGPYVVSGDVPLAVQVITPNAAGQSWEWVEGTVFPARATYKLCRCGRSRNAPYCDSSHVAAGFDGEETASRDSVASQSETSEGPSLTLSTAAHLCAFARFCDPAGQIWALIERTDEPPVRDLVIREAMHCPAGRLVLHDNESGEQIEEVLPPSIGVVEDPVVGCSGPLWIRGGIVVESADGTEYEARNRMTLCRCGASTNKPFCNGSHASVMFDDGRAR